MTCAGASVAVGGAPLEPAVSCAAVVGLAVVGDDGSNTISIAGVTASAFTSLDDGEPNSISVAAGGGSDFITGSESSKGGDRIRYSGLETYPCGFVPDTTPAETTIDAGPPPISATAVLAFHSDEPGSTFECRLNPTFACKLDAGEFPSCASPKHYPSLEYGDHVFTVRAQDAAQNAGDPKTFAWTVLAPTPPPPPAPPPPAAPPPPPQPPPASPPPAR